MTKSEQIDKDFNKIFESITEEYSLQMHGSYRYPVYPGWKAGMQNYHDIHILYISGGKGTYHMEDGTNIPLEKGSLVIITHGIRHNASVDKDHPLRISGIRFGIYDNMNQHVSRYLITPFYYASHPQNIQKMEMLTEDLHAVYHERQEGHRNLLCSAYLIQIISMLYDALRNKSLNKVNHHGMEAVKHLIENSIFEKKMIQDIAYEMGISIRYLQKRFKSAYGMTPKEYSIQVQMNKAYTLLADGNKNSKEIAHCLGYSDQYVFSRQFKKYFGYPPSYVQKQRDRS